MAGAYLNAMQKLQAIDNALARLDGHTCHEGHTIEHHKNFYRSVLTEIEHIMGRNAEKRTEPKV
jgi:hypothetical protein